MATTMDRTTRVRLVVLSFLLAFLAVVALWAVHRFVPDRPLPPRTAGVTSVARIYFAAAEREDCGVTRALTTSHTWAWCSDPRLRAVHDVGHAYSITKGVAHAQRCVDTTVETGGSSDGSMPRGSEPWDFCFVPTATGWRLFDQGQG